MAAVSARPWSPARGVCYSAEVTDADGRLLRAPTLAAIEARDALALVAPDGSVRELQGDSAALASAVLAYCAAARTLMEIRAHVAELTDSTVEAGGVLDDLVGLLVACAALVPAPSPTAPATTSRAGARPRLVLCMGGAIAAAHAPAVLQALDARGYDVRVVASANALRFVGREALEALTHHDVASSMWQPTDASRVPHVELAEWADAVLVWPATATTLSRIATGDCSELVSAVAITTRAPVLLAPSMNEAMLDAPSVQRNLDALKEDGFHVVPTALAVEVARAPGERTPMHGGAPSGANLARLVDLWLRARWARDARVLPRDAAEWETFHRRVPERAQAWFTAEMDPRIAGALLEHAPPPGLLWDLGTGHGTTALWAAGEGYQVLATDVSPTALARAQARAGDARIVFVEDDVTRSAIRGVVDVIVDRGTLHTLPAAGRGAYARQLLSCARPGGLVLIEMHAVRSMPTDVEQVTSSPLGEAQLLELLGPKMELVRSTPGVFLGALDPAPPSTLFVLRRARA